MMSIASPSVRALVVPARAASVERASASLRRAVAPALARRASPVSWSRRAGSALRVAASAEGDDANAPPTTPPTPPPATTPPPAEAPSLGKPGVGKPPINPAFLALGDFSAALLITLVARGAAGQDIIGVGSLLAAAPFVVGWVGAGFFAGDYDADSPNAALWGDAPRAMTTGALTWFSGSAFAILLRNVEGSVMTFPPPIDEKVEFAGALALICAFRAAVAVAKPGVESK